MLSLDSHEEDLLRRSSGSTVSSVPPADGSTSSSPPTPLRVASPKRGDGGKFSSGNPEPPKLRPGSVEREIHRAARNEPLEIEDIEDSDFEEDCRENMAGNVKCTCARETSDRGEVKGRVPTPVLRKSASPTRHHLDLTTPSGDGLLIPSTTYPRHSPKFRRDMRASAPVNPLPDETVDRYIRDAREAKKPAREKVSSVPKHIPASSSPHHAHCVPSGDRDAVSRGDGVGSQARTGRGRAREGEPHLYSDGARRGGRAESHAERVRGAGPRARSGGPGTGMRGVRSVTSPHHVRKLNFDHPSKPGLKHAPPPRSNQPTRVVTAPGPSAKSLSCQTCGTCLQPGIPPPSSAPTIVRDGRPMAQTFYPATLNSQPSRSVGQQRHELPRTNGVPHAAKRETLVGSQRPYKSTSRELFTSPTPNGRREASRSPTLPYAPASYGDVQTRLKVSHPTPQEVDSLSVSSMSLSSCSVASEILEKAKKRRDHFWTSQHQSRE